MEQNGRKKDGAKGEAQRIEQEEGYSCLASRPDLSSPGYPIPVSTSLNSPLSTPPHLRAFPQLSLSLSLSLSPAPLVPLPPSPTMAQPPTYPAHRPTIPHSNTPTDRSIPTNYQAAPRLSFYPSTLNGPENRVDTPARMDPLSLSLSLFIYIFLSI